MDKKRRLGIWMCQSRIHLMEYNNEEPIDMTQLPIDESQEMNTAIPEISYNAIRAEENNRKLEEYKKLAEQISKYDEIVLFGPVDAKKEFQNYLETSPIASMPQLTVQQTENLTEAQQVAYVHNHFKKSDYDEYISKQKI